MKGNLHQKHLGINSLQALVAAFVLLFNFSVNAAVTCNGHFNAFGTSANSLKVKFIPHQLPTPRTSYAWSFGDNTTDSVVSPSHTYAAPGTYYACLTVTRKDTSGNVLCSDMQCDSIHIFAPPPPVCNAHFNSFHSSNSSLKYNFSGSFNAGGAAYAWDFGDGTTLPAGTRNNSHTYATAGNYNVCLTVTRTDTSGNVLCTANWCDSIHIATPPPPVCNAHFTMFHSSNVSLNYSFSAANNGAGANYSWNFGDGNTVPAGTKNISHTYAAAGDYNVCLTVTRTDTSGNVICSSNECDNIHIATPPPPVCNAHFAANHNRDYSLDFTFYGAFNAAGATYAWDYGDGSTNAAGTRVITHSYAAPGAYNVCLTVTRTDTSGNVLCSSNFCDSIHIAPPPPICTAQFSHVHFGTNLKEYFNSRPNPPGTIYSWEFGDGSPVSNLKNPNHTYSVAATYLACLTVTVNDTAGNLICTSTNCDSVYAGSYHDNHRNAIGADVNTESATAIIYPNPLTENSVMHIANTTGAVTLKVFESTGRLMMQKDNLSNGDVEFKKDLLTSGFYLYRITDSENNIVTGRMIVQ